MGAVKLALGAVGLPLAIIAQATGSGGFDLNTALQQLGVGAVLLVPAYVIIRWLMRRVEVLEGKNEALQEDKVALVKAARDRERELADSMAPLLAKLGELVHDAPEVIDKALTKAKDQEDRQTTDKRVRSIEVAVDALLKRARQE